MVTFCIDRIVDGKPYPNLAHWEARPYTPEWRKFSVNWPYSEPVHFLEYLKKEEIEYKLVPWTQATKETLYPISLSYFDFGVDWCKLLPVFIREKLRSKSLTLWFFYSEGDNPQRIQEHILAQFANQDIDPNRIKFTSANSSAKLIKNFTHFVDDECLYQLRNQNSPIAFDHTIRRRKKYTALVRTHKWWRATTMARLWRQGLHECGYFSYNTQELINDDEYLGNPIEVDLFDELRADTHQFLACGPFRADELDSTTHNLYATTVNQHFNDSYLNIILETHLDADQSGGTFLTEKTFKPIKNCQPFLLVGPAGSITQLKNMGYCTFDHVIDHSYDQEINNTRRWDMVCTEIERLITQVDLHQLYFDCRDDLLHNQQLFLSNKKDRLNSVIKELTTQ
jgi:hypothetical protein